MKRHNLNIEIISKAAQIVGNMSTAISVFPNDFTQFDENEDCSNKYEALNQFMYPSDLLPNSSMARKECEQYCTNKQSCWGCIHRCEQSCQWYAVISCNYQERSKVNKTSEIYQKSGKHVVHQL